MSIDDESMLHDLINAEAAVGEATMALMRAVCGVNERDNRAEATCKLGLALEGLTRASARLREPEK